MFIKPLDKLSLFKYNSQKLMNQISADEGMRRERVSFLLIRHPSTLSTAYLTRTHIVPRLATCTFTYLK